MDINFVDADTPDFDSPTYIRMLVAIAKADKDNGPKEYAFVRQQAERLGLDYEYYLNDTEKDYFIGKKSVSRLTALVVLKDAIALASLDRNFSLPERQRVYGFAEKLDIPRNDVDQLEELVSALRSLNDRWRHLVQLR